MSSKAKLDVSRVAQQELFNQVPFAVAIIDADLNVAVANSNFNEHFGDWRGHKCYEAFKRESKECQLCHVRTVLHDGLVHVTDESGVDRHGRPCHYAVHFTPIKDTDGEVRHVMAMASDLTRTRRWQREYNRLFERVPCFVFVVDRDFHIIRSNEKFRRAFGEPAGNFCYAVFKRCNARCVDCPTSMTFVNGEEYSSEQVSVNPDGSSSHFIVTSTALTSGKHGVEQVIEMAVDITDTHMLESELRETKDFYHQLIQNAPIAILGLDPHGRMKIMNRAARKLLEWEPRKLPDSECLQRMLPGEFFSVGTEHRELLELEDTVVTTAQNTVVPVRLSVAPLCSGHKDLGLTSFIVDLSAMKRLEQEKLDAERMAAVGQTVAGLSHTIKNLLMGLKGGMYMVDTGLHRADAARIQEGWEMLQRNFEKTTTLVNDFLSFAKGRTPDLQPVDPNGLVKDLVALYKDAARLQHVDLSAELDPNVAVEPLDPKGIESCLTNLLSNAIDAATAREDQQGKVVLRTAQQNDELIFEVTDNGCGMDADVKSKVFTAFFTTKGNKGTGLGLLTTRRIVQEHGGRIEVESNPGKGTAFRIHLPLRHMQAISARSTGAPALLQEQS